MRVLSSVTLGSERDLDFESCFDSHPLSSPPQPTTLSINSIFSLHQHQRQQQQPGPVRVEDHRHPLPLRPPHTLPPKVTIAEFLRLPYRPSRHINSSTDQDNYTLPPYTPALAQLHTSALKPQLDIISLGRVLLVVRSFVPVVLYRQPQTSEYRVSTYFLLHLELYTYPSVIALSHFDTSISSKLLFCVRKVRSTSDRTLC